jgi:prepilin-type N-terminal cleavage/methylation domain-containing protein
MKGPHRFVGRRRRGFTLAEVAVTIALVGLALAWMLQVLNAAKLNAIQARNLKLARELALLTVGQIQGGLFADELDDDRIEGSYAEEHYPDFAFEAVIGDENFRPDENDRAAFDNWRHEQSVKERENDEEDEEAEQPYEKIQVKVIFPKIQDQTNEYVLELWVPWEQIHPPAEGTGEAGEGGEGTGGNSGSPNGGSR